MVRMLTPLELKVMDILWQMESGFVKDILDNWKDESKPAYNTVSTIVRILQNEKQMIGHRAKGRTHEYYPLISKEDYQKFFLKNAVEKVFAGSVSSLLSTLMDDETINQQELDELKKLLKD